MKRERLDKYMVSRGHTATRSRARDLIIRGEVMINGLPNLRPSHLVTDSDLISLTSNPNYLGRGSLKLKGAIGHFDIKIENKVVADVGASVGGFTDYLLQLGALKVFAIDVGHEQLSHVLRKDPRVVNMEGVNIKFPQMLDQKVDLAVVDLSFISLKKVLFNIKNLCTPQGEILALFKPQFEVGRKNLNKKGLVEKEDLLKGALDEFCNWCLNNKYRVQATTKSLIRGKEGQQEFWVYLNE